MLDILINWFCDQLDTFRLLLPVPSISLAGLGGSSAQILLPHDEGGFRAATGSPLSYVADTISSVSWLFPVDQLILAVGFIAAAYLMMHVFRGVRWVIQLLRGSGS